MLRLRQIYSDLKFRFAPLAAGDLRQSNVRFRQIFC
jgi:hypothetical protein